MSCCEEAHPRHRCPCCAGPPPDGAPPTGAILDLNSTPIPSAFQKPSAYRNYSVNYTAAAYATSISFAFRDDPGYLYLDDVSVTDATKAGSNLLVNSGFELGLARAAAPIGWTYFNENRSNYSGLQPT